MDQHPDESEILRTQERPGVKLHQIKPGSKRFEKIIKLIPRRSHSQTQVFYVENQRLTNQHLLEFNAMNSRNGNGANPMRLWHGTDAKVADTICSNGFDRSYSKVAQFGKGVYFANDPEYSLGPGYAKPDPAGVQTLLLTHVLVGNPTIGRYNQLGVPAGFDSFVNTSRHPGIFVSGHRDPQCLVEYLIQVKK